MNNDRNDGLGADRVREAVREHYGRIAGKEPEGEGGGSVRACCGARPAASLELGYGADELAGAPAEANLGLGCGNPGAIAALRAGEVVLDLGSGGGLDCFLAARRVGPAGRVIGVDMTSAMVARARAAARRLGAANIEFRLGEIEALPVADASVDVVLSNCVINLSPQKDRVLAEAFRVLKPGGRLAVTDVVALAPLPADLRADPGALAACVGGAASVPELEAGLAAAGFMGVRIEVRGPFESGDPRARVASATIEGWKPADGRSCC